MSEEMVRKLYSEAEDFSRHLAGKGWIADRRITASETTSPSDLFATDGGDRPLVVGLFGGTGVGKSSLLNQLAGSDVARTGVVRPTSMEITAYLHNDKQLAALPEGFPRDHFSEVHHSNEKFSDVMWVDMPDFDSEETQNRDHVLKWLPHIDLLLYVVTPERYKDEEGWRLLLENGYGHAWLFIMNQWDRAQDIQLEDFTALLAKAGFDTPRVYRTVCIKKDGEPEHPENEFGQLAEFVALLAERNTIAQLEQRGWLQRLNRARSRLDDQIAVLGVDEQEVGLSENFEQRWAQFCASVRINLDLPFKEFSQQFADTKSASLTSALKSITGKSGTNKVESSVMTSIAAKSDVTALWDDWSETRLKDMFSQFELAEAENGVPVPVIAMVKQDVAEKASAHVKAQMQLQLDKVIQSPGSPWQRAAVVIIKWLQWLIPLAAALWVGYRIVNGFVAGAADSTSYVGFDFLVNGVLLIAISALVPWVLARLLRPSIPKSVYSALQAAVTEGLEQGTDGYRDRLNIIGSEKSQLLNAASELHQRVSKVTDKSVVLNNPDLKGMLLS